MDSKQYYVYIVASQKNGTLYMGVTSHLLKRIYEHKNKLFKSFTSKYNINQLVYFEPTADVQAAIAREKQLKNWLKARKVMR